MMCVRYRSFWRTTRNFFEKVQPMNDLHIIMRGAGDLASGVAHRLHRSGFKVLLLEVAEPLVVRRTVSFAQAVIDGATEVEGVRAVKIDAPSDIETVWQQGALPVLVDPAMDILHDMRADVVIDATLAKRDTGMRRDMAPLTIALGPGFEAGNQVHVVVETNRGHDMGRLIFKGAAEPDTGTPGLVKGFGVERVLRSPCSGAVRHVVDIGAQVKKGDVICTIGAAPVRAQFDGVVRGLIMDGREVPKGLKIGDVDPRAETNCYTISDKARALGGSVLEAILMWHRGALSGC
jgi:xanthine dehydrogenase accessory factor